jgi:hypothetical protein
MSQTPEQDSAESPMTVINGRVKVPVKTEEGKTVDVLVITVPISKAPDYLSLQPKLSEFLMLVTGSTAEFIDSLDDESLFRLDDIAQRLNNPRIARYLTRQRAVLDLALKRAEGLGVSTNSLQTLLPSA